MVEPQGGPVMKEGFYNQNSQLQQAVLHKSLPILEQITRELRLPSDGILRVLDCGCSQGRTSVTAARLVIDTLEQRMAEEGSSLPLSVQFIHEDLPTNDFSTLLHTINHPVDGYMHYSGPPSGDQGAVAGPAGSQSSAGHLSVYSSFIGHSMYERLMPDSSLSIVLAFTCLHWLRSKPCLPADMALPYLSQDKAFTSALKQEFMDGLRSFARHRAREVQPGGALLFHLPAARSPRPAYIGALDRVLRTMHKEELLSTLDFGHMCTPDYVATPEEIQEALGPVLELWELRSSQVHEHQHPAWAQYTQGGCSREELASACRGFWQAVYEPCYLSGLQVRHSEAEAAGLVEEIFRRLEEEYAKEPLPFIQSYVHVYMVRRP